MLCQLQKFCNMEGNVVIAMVVNCEEFGRNVRLYENCLV
jgi:hypothetical protein